MINTPAADPTAEAAQSFGFVWLHLNNHLIYYIAVAIGFFIIFISYFFGGGKKNRIKIFFCILTGTAVGALTLPLLLQISGNQPDPILIGFFIFLDLIFTATVTCHLYELLVIGTHEAFMSGK